MMRPHIRKYLWVISCILFAFSLPVQAQSALTIFVVSETHHVLHLSAVNLTTSNVETIATWQTREILQLGEVLPAAELEILQQQSRTITELEGRTLNSASTYEFQTTVRTIAVAPNGEQVAVALQRQVCLRRSVFDCFGVSQLLLIDVFSKDVKLLGEILLRSPAQGFYPKGCQPVLSVDSDNLKIERLSWSPDGSFLLAMLTGDGGCFRADSKTNKPLVYLSINDNGSLQKLGEAATYAFSPDNSTLATITWECHQTACRNIINRLEIETRRILRSSPIDPSLTVVGNGILYLGETVVVLTSDVSYGQLVRGYYLVEKDGQLDFQLAFQRDGELKTPFTEEGGPLQLKMSGDATMGFVESQMHTLWQVALHGTQIVLTPIYLEAVQGWQIGRDNMLLIQKAGSELYSIIDTQGFELHANISLDTLLQTDAGNDKREIRAIAW